jgi:hypothetical protein
MKPTITNNGDGTFTIITPQPSIETETTLASLQESIVILNAQLDNYTANVNSQIADIQVQIDLINSLPDVPDTTTSQNV